MSSTPPDPPEKPASPDGFDHLEEMHKRLKETQEAWRKLLENLGKLDPKETDEHNPEKPSA